MIYNLKNLEIEFVKENNSEEISLNVSPKLIVDAYKHNFHENFLDDYIFNDLKLNCFSDLDSELEELKLLDSFDEQSKIFNNYIKNTNYINIKGHYNISIILKLLKDNSHNKSNFIKDLIIIGNNIFDFYQVINISNKIDLFDADDSYDRCLTEAEDYNIIHLCLKEIQKNNKNYITEDLLKYISEYYDNNHNIEIYDELQTYLS